MMPVGIIPNLPPLPRPNPEAEIPVSGDAAGVPFFIRLRVIRTTHAWLCFCPRCGKRAAVLYFPPGSADPSCRACLRLVYGSQYDYTPAWVDIARSIMRWYGPR